MTSEHIVKSVAEALGQIAPEIDLEDVDRDADLREEFDIDSMDFLNLVTALGRKFSIEMPEADYARMGSFTALVAYIAEKTTESS